MKQMPGQINIFVFLNMEKPKRKRQPKQNKSHLRDAWEQYGISKSRYLELKEYCQSSNSDRCNMIAEIAYETNPMIGEHIYQSVTKNFSYEGVEFLDGHRIPCGRTDFYGWRRNFYHRLDERMKNGETEENKM